MMPVEGRLVGGSCTMLTLVHLENGHYNGE